jgi:hypothetical protein
MRNILNREQGTGNGRFLVGVVSWSGRMDFLTSSLELELVTRTLFILELELQA